MTKFFIALNNNDDKKRSKNLETGRVSFAFMKYECAIRQAIRQRHEKKKRVDEL